MTKTFTFLLGALAAASGVFASERGADPVFFSTDFEEMTELADGWIQYGTDGVPSGSTSAMFPGYSATSSFVLADGPSSVMAFTPSEFEDGQKADQWLITPEIEIDSPTAILCYTVAVRDNKSRNRFKVLLSESGTAKEDFSQELYSSTITGKGQSFSSSVKRMTLDGYGGKKIRLAFVDYDNSAGIMGFGDIKVAQYDLSYTESEVSRISVSETADNPSFTVRLSTPVKTEGLTAVLTTEDGQTATFTTDYVFDSGLASTCPIVFDKSFVMGDNVSLGFSVAVTPNFDGALTTDIRGTFVRGIYPAVAVMEEFTGTWCGYCPRGAAFMNYYTDNYGLAEGKGRFIGIALHGSDIMQPPFFAEITRFLPSPGYPYAYLNRTVGGDPMELKVVDALNGKTFGDIKISRVDYNDAKGTLSVSLGTALCFDTDKPGVSVSAYLVENDIVGDGTAYNQTNNYSGVSSEEVVKAFGEEFLPYFKPYLSMPSEIPYIRMTYNEVARQLTPSPAGEVLTEPATAFVYNESELELEMGTNVLKPENTEVIVLLTTENGKEILSADVVKFSDFNKDLFEFTGEPVYPEGYNPGSSVTEISAEADIVVRNGIIEVSTSHKADLTVYSADGLRVHAESIQAGKKTICPQYKGVALIKLNVNGVSKTVKAVL